MSNTNVSQNHVVLTSTPMWSHLRGLCVFASRLVAASPVTVSLLVPNWMTTFKKAQAEVTRCLSGTDKPLGHIRVVAIGEHSVDLSHAAHVPLSQFTAAWKSLLDESPLQCSSTGAEYPAAPRPTFVALDGFQYTWLRHVRETTESSPIPALMWVIHFSGGFIQMAMPQEYGGLGDILRVSLTGTEEEHGASDFANSGAVLQMRGEPGMYDWEIFPQDLSHIPGLGGNESTDMRQLAKLPMLEYFKTANEADGFITSHTAGYDGEELLSSIKEYTAKSNRPVFNIGPTIPFQPGTSQFSQSSLDAEMAATPAGVGSKVKSYLDAALLSNGEGSVMYICFGTMFWPNNPDHVWLLLEVLAERGVPFILAHTSPMAQVPQPIKERFDGSTKGLLIPWSPQQMVLAHKAVGCFVTHGGAGGTMDALTQGVVMIGWPFGGDQTSNVAHLTHTLDVAFEFIEVRSGKYGLKPMYATGKTAKGTLEAFRHELNGILDDLASDVGKRKKANAQKHQQEIAKAWGEGGVGRKALDELITIYRI